MSVSAESRSQHLRHCLALLTGGLVLLAVFAWRETRPDPIIPPTSSAARARTAPHALPTAASVNVTTRGASSSRFEAELEELRLLAAGAGRSRRLAHLLAGAADLNSDDALCVLAHIKDDAFRRECVNAFFSGWATREPSAVAAWLLAQPSAVRGSWASALIAVLADTPASIAEIVPRLVHGDPEQAADYLRPALAALTAGGDFSQAATLTALADDSLLRGPLREALATDWANANPRAAAAWILTLADSPERDGILGHVAETWSAAQPEALATFAVALPDGLGRTHALTLAVQTWAERDATAAAAWLAERMPAPELDTPVFALATTPAVLAASPAVAARWAESIANPDVRLQGLRVVLEQWAVRDRDAARGFVMATPALSDDFRHTLLNEIDHS
jgi:hypothetical protein